MINSSEFYVELYFSQHKKVSKKKTYTNGETVRDERGDNIAVSDLFKVDTFFVICYSVFQSVSGRSNNEEYLKCKHENNKTFQRQLLRIVFRVRDWNEL